jgi:polyisoprenoid-binding protein YceI
MPRRSAVLVACLLAAAPVAAATWNIDPAHTTVQFAVRHMMVSNVRGELGKVTGGVQGDPAAPTAAKLDVTIDAASIDTRNEKRDQHLKSPDFLDVEKYPTIRFVSKTITAGGPGAFKVAGDLTLHGVTKEIVLDVTDVTPPIKDPMGMQRAGAHATTTIDRTAFGINWSKTLDGGGVVVGNEVQITVDVEATLAQ